MTKLHDTTDGVINALAARLPPAHLHNKVKCDLLRYAIASVADAMGWGSDVLDFTYVVMPYPVMFALISADGQRSLIALMEDARDITIRAQTCTDTGRTVCERRVAEPAMRTFRGDYGELAKQDAIERFKRLRTIDFAEDQTHFASTASMDQRASR